MIQEKPTIFLHRVAVDLKGSLGVGVPFRVPFPPMKNERRVIFDLRQAADDFCELGKIMLNHAGMARCGQSLPDTRASLLVLDRGEQVFHVDVRVPEIEHAHLAKLRHSLPVGSNAGRGCIPGKAFTEAVVSTSENKAGSQALHVPLPGCGERFIQIVDVKNDPSLGGGERAEVEKMTIAASLHAQSGRRRVAQIGGHVQRRTSVESKRRLQHSSVPDGNKLRDTSLVRFLHKRQGIGPVVRRIPIRVRFSRAFVTQPLACGTQFGQRRAGQEGALSYR